MGMPSGAFLRKSSPGSRRLHCGCDQLVEDRLEWLTDLGLMGARAEIRDAHHAVITGPARLQGAEVKVGDLRAGASLILGALAAASPTPKPTPTAAPVTCPAV